MLSNTECPVHIESFTLLFLLVVSSIAANDDSTQVGSKPEGKYFVIETRHRLFPKFVQVDTIAPDSSFTLGEEEYHVEVVTFNPHFGITTEGEFLQMSDTLYNPAVRLRVTLADSLVQESWAFYYMSTPHFYRDRMFAFRLIGFNIGDKYVKPPLKELPDSTDQQ